MKQAQFDDVQRLAQLGCWEWDVAANSVSWTDGLYRIYGLDRAAFDATFEGYLSRIHPDDRERVADTVRAAYATGSIFDFEERIVRPDGEVRWLRSRGRVERDADGRALRLLGVCHDVTELYAAREQAVDYAAAQGARREAEAAAGRVQFLADASAILASSLDYEQTLRNVARLAVPQIADWCAVDLATADGSLRRVAVEHPNPERVSLAYRLQEEYPPPKEQSASLRVLRTGQAEFAEEIPEELITAAAVDEEHLRLLRGLGLRSYVIAPLRTGDRVLGVMSFVHAESERRFSERDLPLLEDLARRAAVAIENAHLVSELHEAKARLAEQMQQLTLQAEQLESQAAEMELQAEELQQTLHELELRNADLEAERSDAEEARQAAEQANRAKSEFLATMSHELRTPLNAISGYAELMQLGLYGPVTPQQVDTIERVQRSQRRLLSLINDILNYARIEAGRLVVDTQAVAVSEMFDELATVIEPQALARGLTLEFDAVPDAVAWADRERTEQILLNLIGNAMKFTPAGGHVSVGCTIDGERIVLSVTDNGPGIPEARLEAIFDPFVQVDHKLTRETEGIGLGLSISRELARAMNGEITVESVVGSGSTFRVALPRATEAVAPPPGPVTVPE